MKGEWGLRTSSQTGVAGAIGVATEIKLLN